MWKDLFCYPTPFTCNPPTLSSGAKLDHTKSKIGDSCQLLNDSFPWSHTDTQIPLKVCKAGIYSEDRAPSLAIVAKMAVGWSRVLQEDLGTLGTLFLYFFHKTVDFLA